MPDRIELDTQTSQSRRTIDASWSPKKKAIVGGLSGVLALGVLGAGSLLAWQNRPVGLPQDAAQAVSMINTGRIDRLDEQRRSQYLAETGRLLRELPEEQRRELVRDDANREAMLDIREAMFDDMTKRFARGEGFEMPWGRGGRPRGDRQGGQQGEREQLTEEERDQRRRERMEQMRNRITGAFESGNSQSVALRGEFFKRMSEMWQQNGGGQRGGPAGGRRPGGGGGR